MGGFPKQYSGIKDDDEMFERPRGFTQIKNILQDFEGNKDNMVNENKTEMDRLDLPPS